MVSFIVAALSPFSAAYDDFDPCVNLEDGYRTDLRDCREFWLCSEGKGTKFRCPDGFIFNNGQYPPSCVPESSDQSTCLEPFCDGSGDDDDEVYSQRVELQCRQFFTCLEGDIHVSDCGEGYAFDDHTGRCDFEWRADCLNCPQENVTGVEEVTRLPDKKNCAGFYICVNGRAHSRECLSGLYYNEIEDRCVGAEEYNCPVSIS